MNVWTGEKEAKLNVPDEQNAELEGLPVDKSVVIVDPDQPEEEDQIRIPAGAPVYQADGKIKEPPKSEESLNFHDSLEILRKGLDIDQALEDLEELSHDIYYGLKIAEDYETVKSLLCLANTDNIFSEDPDPVDVRRARLAALTIAATLQNNAKALKEVEKHWPALVQRNCAGFDDRLNAAQIIPDPKEGRSTGDLALAKARASALNSLLKIDGIREHVVKLGGMGQLLEVLVSETGEEWEPAKRRVAQLVQDNFLDADMGAKLGLWPVDDQKSDKECQGLSETELTSRPSCWDYAARRLSEENSRNKGHWSHELWRQLKEARKSVPKTDREKTEL
jgi:nucleotide exchange factor SIL1